MTATVLTLTTLASRWHTTRGSLLAKIHAGELRAFRVGKRVWRVTIDEVLRVERGGVE